MIIKPTSSVPSSAVKNRRQKKSAIRARRSQKNQRLNFNQLERRNLLATFVVNSLVDDNSGVADGLVSLREAIIASNTNQAFGDAVAGSINGDRIVFDASVSGVTHSVDNGQYTITDDLVVSGRDLGVQFDADQRSRFFDIQTSEAVTLFNLTLTRGRATEGGAIRIRGGGTTRLVDITVTNSGALEGGAIHVQDSTLFATRLVADRNLSSGNFGGGAFAQIGGNVGIFDSVFTDNRSVTRGGAVLVSDGTFFASNTTIGGENSGVLGGGIYLRESQGNIVGGSITGNRASSNVEDFGRGGGISIEADSTLRLSGVDVSGNSARTGGGIHIEDSELRVVNGSRIHDNFTESRFSRSDEFSRTGGGIFSDNGDVFIVDSEISSNTSDRDGGGGITVVASDGLGIRLIVRDSTISDNIANGNFGYGGGVSLSGDVAASIVGGAISGNTAESEGGGISNISTGLLFVSGVNITDNEASGAVSTFSFPEGEVAARLRPNGTAFRYLSTRGGGGIFNNGEDVRLINSTIEGNSATGALGNGGGVFSATGTVFVSGSTISGNRAVVDGGGFEIADGRLDVFGSTISGNVAGVQGSTTLGDGGGVHVTGRAITTTFRNSVISANSATGDGGGVFNQVDSALLVEDTRILSNVAAGSQRRNGGGGVFNNGGTVRLLSSFVLRNDAVGALGSGGGVFSRTGAIVVEDSRINDNTANGNGGGISITDANFRIENTNLNRNIASGSALGNGGAVYVGGSVSRFVSNGSTFFENESSGRGGAISIDAGSRATLLDNSRVLNSVSGGFGGGVFNQGRLVALDTLFSANDTSRLGGAVYNDTTGSSFLNAIVVEDNAAVGLGGGLANFGELWVVDSFFENNSGRNGGAIAALAGVTNEARNTFVGNSPNDILRV